MTEFFQVLSLPKSGRIIFHDKVRAQKLRVKSPTPERSTLTSVIIYFIRVEKLMFQYVGTEKLDRGYDDKSIVEYQAS